MAKKKREEKITYDSLVSQIDELRKQTGDMGSIIELNTISSAVHMTEIERHRTVSRNEMQMLYVVAVAFLLSTLPVGFMETLGLRPDQLLVLESFLVAAMGLLLLPPASSRRKAETNAQQVFEAAQGHVNNVRQALNTR